MKFPLIFDFFFGIFQPLPLLSLKFPSLVEFFWNFRDIPDNTDTSTIFQAHHHEICDVADMHCLGMLMEMPRCPWVWVVFFDAWLARGLAQNSGNWVGKGLMYFYETLGTKCANNLCIFYDTLEPNWPLFWLETAWNGIFFGGLFRPKIEDTGSRNI